MPCGWNHKSAFLASSPFAISRLQKKLNLVSFLGRDIRGPERGAGRRWEVAVRLGPYVLLEKRAWRPAGSNVKGFWDGFHKGICKSPKTLFKMLCTLKMGNTGRYVLCSWIERLNIAEMSVLPSLIYTFGVITVETPMGFFKEPSKLILKFGIALPRLPPLFF